MDKERRLRQIESTLASLENKLRMHPEHVKAPLWELKIKDLHNDKKLLQSSKNSPDSLSRYRTGVTISPPSGNFNAKR